MFVDEVVAFTGGVACRRALLHHHRPSLTLSHRPPQAVCTTPRSLNTALRSPTLQCNVRLMLWNVSFSTSSSALDETLESALYGLLRRELPDTIVVSVAHGHSVDEHHQRRLTMVGGGAWRIECADAVREG